MKKKPQLKIINKDISIILHLGSSAPIGILLQKESVRLLGLSVLEALVNLWYKIKRHPTQTMYIMNIYTASMNVCIANPRTT